MIIQALKYCFHLKKIGPGCQRIDSNNVIHRGRRDGVQLNRNGDNLAKILNDQTRSFQPNDQHARIRKIRLNVECWGWRRSRLESSG